MKTKRIITLAVAAVLTLVMLAGCGTAAPAAEPTAAPATIRIAACTALTPVPFPARITSYPPKHTPGNAKAPDGSLVRPAQ